MDRKELDKILENHKHWLHEDIEGWEDMRADLCDANLRSANLRRADLCGADLCGADLRDANLRGADLRSADLCGANLRSAYLCDADLRSADLRGADLCGADLCSANLRSADLCGANLCGAKNIPFVPYSCPEFGSFIGYKKAQSKIVELEILEDSKRLSATGRKCRCDKAKVIGIYDYEHNLLDIQEVESDRDVSFIYRVGEIVSVDDFDDNRWNECSTGIHFFINFQEAVNY